MQIKFRKLDDDPGKDIGKITLNQVISNAFLFLLAGFETSSTTMKFCLLELAQNIEIQNRLRQEIRAVLERYDNQITYESLSEMKYLEQVINVCIGAKTSHNPTINVSDLSGRYVIDTIGQCVFGINPNTILDDTAPFRAISAKIFSMTPMQMLKHLFMQSFRNTARKFHMKLTKKDVEDFFLSLNCTQPEGNFTQQTKTLRKYPPGGNFLRVAKEDFKVGNKIIERDTLVVIPLYGIHRDENFHSNPLIFNPDRPELAQHSCMFMPFGDGPRHCIGRRFALHQVKLVISALVSHYRFSPTPDASYSIELAKNTVLLKPQKPIFLNVERLSQR
uniref:Uncharacterized protein n=1 Tax=Phlebotomus papatasi TaxID=29031 RepID=A0A1B0CYS0_PHLPP